jgi:hypothetical protein
VREPVRRYRFGHTTPWFGSTFAIPLYTNF